MPFVIVALILCTSIWVYYDANKLGVRATGEKPRRFRFHADMDPVDWSVSFLLLWFIAFPAYLILRRGYVKKFQQLRSSTAVPPREPVEYFYERIRNLSKLKSKGVISEKEFSLKRKEVLGL
jgi:hypothetical protein